MKILPAQHLRESDYRDITLQVQGFFYAELFRPLILLLREFTARKIMVENALGDALRRALLSGKILYRNGAFQGQFSAAEIKDLRAIGAKWRRFAKAYELPEIEAPLWVRASAATYKIKSQEAYDLMHRELKRIGDAVGKGRYDVNPAHAVKSVDQGWRDSAKQLMVFPRLDKAAQDELGRDYTANMDLYIKRWLESQIRDLRADVEVNANAGYRFDNLISTIQRHGSASASHAKFLARQETGLYMSKYRALRFQQVGVQRYRWDTAHDARVRPEPGHNPKDGNHRALDGQVFTYAKKAPAAFMSCGERCNPGEDFGCRCVDRPILE